MWHQFDFFREILKFHFFTILPEFVYSKVYFTSRKLKLNEEGKCEGLNKKQSKVLNCHTIVRFFPQTAVLSWIAFLFPQFASKTANFACKQE